MRIRLKRVSIYMFCALMVSIMGCHEEPETDLEIRSELKSVLIDINVADMLLTARPGDEVPDFVLMYNGEANHANGTQGESNLITELQAGDEIVWRLADAEGVKITGFEFFVISGDNAFEIEGGETPQPQTDGSWKARISPNLNGEALLKYNVLFEVDGKSYWWDPIVKVSSEGDGEG